MWQRLSDNEINAKRDLSAKKHAVFFSLFIIVTSIFTVKTGHQKYVDPSYWNSLSWLETLYFLPFILLFGVVVFYLTYQYKKRGRSSLSLFCTSCGKSHTKVQGSSCECGGEIDYLEDYKYVKGPDETSP